MRKAQFKSYFERLAVTEKLAREFARRLGYKISDDAPVNFMEASDNPRSQMFYEMALKAVEMLAKEEFND